jgi:hypothetical protein
MPVHRVRVLKIEAGSIVVSSEVSLFYPDQAQAFEGKPQLPVPCWRTNYNLNQEL